MICRLRSSAVPLPLVLAALCALLPLPGPAAAPAVAPDQVESPLPASAAAPQAAPTAVETAPLRVELAVAVLDAKGNPWPQPLSGDQFVLLEDGACRPLLGVSSLAPGDAPWEVVVYVDRVLSSTAALRNAAGALAAQAGDLAALGTVEVVVAEPEPESALQPTREAYAIDEALSRLAVSGEGRDDLRQRRRRFRNQGADREAGAASEVGDEARLVRRQQDRFAAWLAEHPRRGPRALFLVSDGWDLDPRTFYGRNAETPAAGEAAEGLASSAAAQARTLASLGWTVIPLAMGDYTAPGLRRFRVLGPEEGAPTSPGSLGRIGVKPPRRRTPEQEARDRERELERTSPLLLDPRSPLLLLAEASGGELLQSPLEMPGALARLRSRLRLSWESSRAADGRPHELQVQSADSKLQVRAARWDATGLPAELDALRARRLLLGEGGEGESGSLPLDAALQLADLAPAAAVAPETTPDLAAEIAPSGSRTAKLELRLDPGSFGERPPLPPLRLTVAVPGSGDDGDERPEITQRLLGVAELSAANGWTWRTELTLPADTDRVAVALAEPAPGGLWGSVLAAVLEPTAAADADDTLLPAAPAVRLLLPDLPPGRQGLSGRIRVRAEASGEASRVSFFLDGRKAGTCGPPPCSAALGLGRQVRPHIVEAVALAADGRELGRDRTRLNRPGLPGGLQVRITAPEAGKADGAIDVAADVQVPPDGRLDRVEFFWNEELAATVYRPPFRARVAVPQGRTGYLRVAARLADGTLAEDAVPMNAAEIGERVDVRLVELFVVVTDGDGRPVRGLDREAFRVLQDGSEQELAGFDDAGELPLTLALAVDTSASMFRKLPGVVKAAQALMLDGLAPGRDSTLLVDFDSEPRLVRRPTRDLDTAADTLERLRPDGRTALWKAIDFSLAQLQGIAGRKALLLYSDGIGDGEDIAFGQALQRVRESGVPVYLIVTHPQAARHGGKLSDRPTLDRLRRLAESSGGRVYFVTSEQDPGPVYHEILAELRSQYVLSYYPPLLDDAREEEPWREVEVEVKKRGLRARTLSGFYGGG